MSASDASGASAPRAAPCAATVVPCALADDDCAAGVGEEREEYESAE